jgi:hypothetical protein
MGATRSKKETTNDFPSSSENRIELKYKEIKQKIRRQVKTIKRLEMENDEYRNKLRLISKISNNPRE